MLGSSTTQMLNYGTFGTKRCFIVTCRKIPQKIRSLPNQDILYVQYVRISFLQLRAYVEVVLWILDLSHLDILPQDYLS